jgi:hypothetical protein
MPYDLLVFIVGQKFSRLAKTNDLLVSIDAIAFLFQNATFFACPDRHKVIYV